MSLPVFSRQESLFGVGSLADKLFAPADRFRLFGEKIWPLLAAARPELETMYCADNGRAAAEPVVLLGVSVLQFLERAPDRQAMEHLAMHLGWKRALHRAAYDPSLLTYFRDRLLAHEQGRLAFDTILDGLREAGLVSKRTRQRLDSTHVLGVVRQMSSLECVRETLRLALESLAEAVAEARRPAVWTQWWERYVESNLDYRAEAATLWAKLDQAGADAWALLTWIMTLPVAVQTHERVTLLAQVFDEYFEGVDQAWRGRRQRLSGGVVNPHEPEAQWRRKGPDKMWIGYQVQVAETAAEQPLPAAEPTRQFLTAVETQSALASDEAGLEQVLTAQEAAGQDKPSQLYVDGAYVSAAVMAAARAQDWELVGPAQPSGHGHGLSSRAVCGEHRSATSAVSGGTDQHAMQSAGGSGDGKGPVPLRVELALSRMRPAGRVRGCGAGASQFGSGRTSRSVAGATARDVDQRVCRTDETARGDRRHDQRIGPAFRVAAGALSRAAEGGVTELVDRRGVQRETLAATDCVEIGSSDVKVVARFVPQHRRSGTEIPGPLPPRLQMGTHKQ